MAKRKKDFLAEIKANQEKRIARKQRIKDKVKDKRKTAGDFQRKRKMEPAPKRVKITDYVEPIVEVAPEPMPLDAIVMFILSVAACALYFLSHVVVFYGAIQMLRFRSPAIARAAAIISVFPFCSPLFVVGIPVGIWALIVLSKPEIRAAFGRSAAQQ